MTIKDGRVFYDFLLIVEVRGSEYAKRFIIRYCYYSEANKPMKMGRISNLFDHYKMSFHATALKMTRSANIVKEITQKDFVTPGVKEKFLVAAKSKNKISDFKLSAGAWFFKYLFSTLL